jgi:hypothetical protein
VDFFLVPTLCVGTPSSLPVQATGSFLKQLNVLSRAEPESRVTLDQVCIASGLLNKEHGRIAATILAGKGWLTLERTSEDSYLSITPAGIEEANRLEVPRLQRWIRDRTIAIPLAVAGT